MDSGALIFGEEKVAGALERVSGRVEGVASAALIFDLVDDVVVELKDGVVDRVDALLAISE